MGSSPSKESMASAKEFVDKTIAENKAVIFSKTYCPYCTKAKSSFRAVLGDLSKVVVVELDQRGDGDAIQDYLLQLTGGRSVPRVFVGGKFIGGGDDTARLQASGELEKLLKEVGLMVAA